MVNGSEMISCTPFIFIGCSFVFNASSLFPIIAQRETLDFSYLRF